MEEIKQCPFCHKVPVFVTHRNHQWVGGCTSGETEFCDSLRDIVYQPNKAYAVSQWNHIMEQMPAGVA